MSILNDEKEVLAADGQRRAAILAADSERLDHLLADDFRYIHASGKVEDKLQYLASISPGKFLSLEIGELDVRTYNGVAVMLGAIDLRRTAEGRIIEKRHQFSGVWVRNDGRWKLSVFQNSSKSTG
ncbi:nuclear transport factor 2 family protein [Ensifer adhaerens]|uniref:Nuclear transport factor 2 family protein n=1 Tax=Ensifer adhaerens TaxID=106592 RepID=A0A9Q9DE77_ENSAD|nr:nuclear transport factor 2 family protein [Ensifer adhaerens]USJ28404.1 nuclear transport factor 2 family protein [Ensifer adhaerens]